MDVIKSSGISTKLWRNASYISNTPDITVPVGLVPKCNFYKLGDWVIVRYLLYVLPRVNLFYFS